MTASTGVRLSCDHPGCRILFPERPDKRHTWADTRLIRKEAEEAGWSVNAEYNRDLCPLHNTIGTYTVEEIIRKYRMLPEYVRWHLHEHARTCCPECGVGGVPQSWAVAAYEAATGTIL